MQEERRQRCSREISWKLHKLVLNIHLIFMKGSSDVLRAEHPFNGVAHFRILADEVRGNKNRDLPVR